ncbi:unnamed protein product [Ascophyllum nodosum]
MIVSGAKRTIAIATVLMLVQRLCPMNSVSSGTAFLSLPSVAAFSTHPVTHQSRLSRCRQVSMTLQDEIKPTRRGEFLFGATGSVAVAATVAAAMGSSFGAPASAYVKGNMPPPNYNKRRGGQTALEREPSEKVAVDEPTAIGTFSVTKSGVRYKDLKIGTGPEVKPTSVVDVRYRVEKLGKRSYDGISGETQSVFSRGYGEDDDKEGDVLTVPLGLGRLVSAVDEGVIGMNVGGVRRVAVRPERGWKKQDPKCATEIDMGALSGVPGSALPCSLCLPPGQVEDCIDLALEPRPVGYGATRRMARRFDETLIVEIEMVGARDAVGKLF